MKSKLFQQALEEVPQETYDKIRLYTDLIDFAVWLTNYPHLGVIQIDEMETSWYSYTKKEPISEKDIVNLYFKEKYDEK